MHRIPLSSLRVTLVALTLALGATGCAMDGAGAGDDEVADVSMELAGRKVRPGGLISRPLDTSRWGQDTGDTGGGWGPEEICDYPDGYSWVGGRCQVADPTGGTMECDCESQIHTSHAADGSCVYEVLDIQVVGSCGPDDGETNDPPIVLESF